VLSESSLRSANFLKSPTITKFSSSTFYTQSTRSLTYQNFVRRQRASKHPARICGGLLGRCSWAASRGPLERLAQPCLSRHAQGRHGAHHRRRAQCSTGTCGYFLSCARACSLHREHALSTVPASLLPSLSCARSLAHSLLPSLSCARSLAHSLVRALSRRRACRPPRERVDHFVCVCIFFFSEKCNHRLHFEKSNVFSYSCTIDVLGH